MARHASARYESTLPNRQTNMQEQNGDGAPHQPFALLKTAAVDAEAGVWGLGSGV